jgi:hypothetical protein
MSKDKNILPDDTLIIWNKHPVNEYRKFFQEKTGGDTPRGKDFQIWLFEQAGKTLAEALEDYLNPPVRETIQDFLTERRFDVITAANKEFIVAFDREIKDFGYDFGGVVTSGNVWSPIVIVYGKTGTKSRPCAARIYIKDDGIMFRLYLNKVDNHRQYIENAPAHIKNAFTSDTGRCTFCWDKCLSQHTGYTVDGQLIQKCQHHKFFFDEPSLEKLPDYIDLLKEFYTRKTKK